MSVEQDMAGCAGEMLLSAEGHRKRLSNLRDADQAVRSCRRKHTIRTYFPGQVTYNLGEYPNRISMAPTSYDVELLQTLAKGGVSLIAIHEEWNDPLRLLGADKFTSPDPKGLQAFIDLVHSLGMKITLYASTGYFDIRDPDFRPDWTSFDFHLVDLFFKYAMCSPASPEWRAYLLPRLERVLDEYGIDGLYNDTGYEPLWRYANTGTRQVSGPYEPLPFRSEGRFRHVSPEPETPDHDAAMEDLLGIIYESVHRRGGVYRLHIGGNRQPNYKSKVYDYLWVGEGVSDLRLLRRETMNHTPYVVPAPDFSSGMLEREDDLYLYSISSMQFPLRVDGRPCTGERSVFPNIEYCPVTPDRAMSGFMKVQKYYQDHPNAYPSFGQWDSCPGRPEARERWLYHLSLYLPMVKKGTRVWIEVVESSLFRQELNPDFSASLFVNDETYLVLANFGKTSAEINTVWSWRDRETNRSGTVWSVPPHDLLFLQRIVQ